MVPGLLEVHCNREKCKLMQAFSERSYRGSAELSQWEGGGGQGNENIMKDEEKSAQSVSSNKGLSGKENSLAYDRKKKLDYENKERRLEKPPIYRMDYNDTTP